jgi:hypothetical protein
MGNLYLLLLTILFTLVIYSFIKLGIDGMTKGAIKLKSFPLPQCYSPFIIRGRFAKILGFSFILFGIFSIFILILLILKFTNFI